MHNSVGICCIQPLYTDGLLSPAISKKRKGEIVFGFSWFVVLPPFHCRYLSCFETIQMILFQSENMVHNVSRIFNLIIFGLFTISLVKACPEKKVWFGTLV